MADYISREAAIAEIKDESGCDFCWAKTKNMCKTMCHTRKKIARIVAIPAADVRPMVRAHWIYHEDDYGDYYECSNCHDEYVVYEGDMHWKFCPTCGAETMAANDRPYGDEGADCHGAGCPSQ